MDLNFNISVAAGYKSNVQKSRVITESWVRENMYFPICGEPILHQYIANRPVADFYCDKCKSDFELKSHEGQKSLPKIIPDGAYNTMIERITSSNNPNLFVMGYADKKVANLIFIPGFFFVPSVIVKRTPLKETARRAGWTGCNINIGLIPNDAKIKIIENGIISPAESVINQYQFIKSLETNNIQARGWLMDTMSCIENIPSDYFTLKDLYNFEHLLKLKYPDNNFIQAKLRQQLQILRDRGFIDFMGQGKYKKVKP